VTAIVALCKRGSGLRLPWRFQFAYPQPRHVEQYWVHLGDALQFDRHLTLLSLPREYLHQPWPDASATVGQVAQQASQQQIDALEGPCAFLDAFYQYLHDNIREPLNLERVALAFAMSPATLKRKLAKHGTHFQEQLDLVRTHVALSIRLEASAMRPWRGTSASTTPPTSAAPSNAGPVWCPAGCSRCSTPPDGVLRCRPHYLRGERAWISSS